MILENSNKKMIGHGIKIVTSNKARSTDNDICSLFKSWSTGRAMSIVIRHRHPIQTAEGR
jgi:hypothetical protein